MRRITGLPRDGNHVPIQGVSRVSKIFTTSIASSAWTAVDMPSSAASKSVVLSRRGGGAFKISTTASSVGSAYFTVSSMIGFDLVLKGGQNICYANCPSAATLEVIVVE